MPAADDASRLPAEQRARVLIDAQLQAASSGLHTLSVSKLKQIKVTLPDIADQQEVIELLGELRAARSCLEREVDIVDRRATALRRALLAVAFSGKLTDAASDIERVEEMADV